MKKPKITSTERPDPPGDLTDEQAHEWMMVVNRMPADWFPRETHPMLIQYCRHVVTCRRVAEMIDNFLADEKEPKSINGFNQLLIMQEREGRAMSSLATRMRVSQQALFGRRKKTGPRIPAPWE